jgi:hypothetical protein
MRFRSFVLPTTSVIRARNGHRVQHCTEVAIVSRVNARRRALIGEVLRLVRPPHLAPAGARCGFGRTVACANVPALAIDPHRRWEEQNACVKP